MPKTKKLHKFILVISLVLTTSILAPASIAAATTVPLTTFAESGCGSDGAGHWTITTSIDFGCAGSHCQPPPPPNSPTSSVSSGNTNTSNSYCTGGTAHNAMLDLLFAIIKFISDGVGLIIIMSLIIAGIQYTFSRGEPQAISSATKRIQSSITALVIFIFAYALLNFITPNGFFGQ